MSIWIIDAGVVSARAEVRMEGSPEALRIEAVDATLVDVLNALKAKFNLRYRANDALEGRITGSFRGSLQRVVARLLEGYDYVIAISPDGIDALILPQNATANVVVAKLPPTMLQPAASPPVMTAQEAKRAR
jgi:cellulose biosynthesis protein BcsQ